MNDLFKLQNFTGGVKHYRAGARLYPAGTVYYNNAHDEKPGLLVLGGTDLAILRDTLKMSDRELLAIFMRAATSFTRIDYCVNIDAGHPSELIEQWHDGNKEGRVKTVQRFDSHSGDGGYTVYVGSRQSDKLLRVYDKAAELKKLGDFVLTRIELQTRKKVAHRMAKAMARDGIKEVGKQVIRDFVNFPDLAWWNDALDGDTVDVQLTPAKETSYERWLLEQVLPSIEKRIKAGVELGAIERFTKDLLRLQGEIIEE